MKQKITDNIALIVVIIILGCFALYGSFPNNHKKVRHNRELYRNEQCVIVGTNESSQDYTHDKFHEPIAIKIWLVQRVSDTTQYAELTSYYKDKKIFYITNEMWYSKDIGDTLYFDHIRRSRFFTFQK